MKQRVIGFIVSLVLTLVAYFITLFPEFFHVDDDNAVVIIIGLAVLQAAIQLIFFIDLWHEKGTKWNINIMVHTFTIILVIIIFTIWIMTRLDYNMMPMMH